MRTIVVFRCWFRGSLRSHLNRRRGWFRGSLRSHLNQRGSSHLNQRGRSGAAIAAVLAATALGPSAVASDVSSAARCRAHVLPAPDESPFVGVRSVDPTGRWYGGFSGDGEDISQPVRWRGDVPTILDTPLDSAIV